MSAPEVIELTCSLLVIMTAMTGQSFKDPMMDSYNPTLLSNMKYQSTPSLHYMKDNYFNSKEKLE